jgi:hypothetical protein
MKTLSSVALCCISLLASPAYAVQCASPGSLSLLKANDGSGYIFFPSRSYGDIVFVLPGREFKKDDGAPQGTVQFFIDGIHYQFLTTAKSQFTSASQIADDLTILARHVQYEQQYVVKMGGRLTEIEELGNRNRPDAGGNPPHVFKLWLLKNPKEPNGARQYYLTTVVGDEVASLSAIVAGPAYEREAVSAFTKFASSFQFVPSETMCPPRAPSSLAQPILQQDLSRQAAPGR